MSGSLMKWQLSRDGEFTKFPCPQNSSAAQVRLKCVLSSQKFMSPAKKSRKSFAASNGFATWRLTGFKSAPPMCPSVSEKVSSGSRQSLRSFLRRYEGAHMRSNFVPRFCAVASSCLLAKSSAPTPTTSPATSSLLSTRPASPVPRPFCSSTASSPTTHDGGRRFWSKWRKSRAANLRGLTKATCPTSPI